MSKSGSPTLLVIDRGRFNRMAVALVARMLGFEATTARCKQAPAALADRAWSVVVIDLSMDDRQCRNFLGLSALIGTDTPVLLLSGAPELVRLGAPAVSRLVELNVAAVVPKPIGLPALQAALRDLRDRLLAAPPTDRAPAPARPHAA